MCDRSRLKAGPVYLLMGLLAAAPLLAAGGSAELVEIPNPEDAISPEQRAHIERVIAAYEAKTRKPGLRTAAEDEPFLYPFFPQAGTLGRDLFLNNFTDQNPTAELVRDWDCSDYTYDGHQGHDSLIRTFREQLIGVPVFAVRDGMVVDTHDGEPDMNTEPIPTNRANYVVVDHGYRYEWKVNGRVVRRVTSAALTDLLPAGTAKGKDKVSCKVTPSDGRKSGPASVAGRSVAEE